MPAPSPANLAARTAASYVRSTPNVDERTGLSAKGLAALHRLETNLAWGAAVNADQPRDSDPDANELLRRARAGRR